MGVTEPRLRKPDGDSNQKTSDVQSKADAGNSCAMQTAGATWSLLFMVCIIFAGILSCLISTIFLVGKLAPTLFLKMGSWPVPGFVLWAITGNEMPPYLFPDAWSEAEMPTWSKDGDLVVSTGVKSGTHWMLYCSHQIRTRGKGDLYDINTDTPWLDLRHKPGQSWAELKEMMNSTVLKDGTRLKDRWDSPSYPFRIFKSHYAPKLGDEGVLPVRENPRIKYLAMARNGLDVYASLMPFWTQHNDAFKETWGGFPPNESPEATFKSLMPGGNLYEHYFPYVRGWWSLRDEPNVLLLHYADAKKDLTGTVQKLAKFLEVDLTAREADEVSHKCSFQHMKTVEDKMTGMLWGHDESSIMKVGGTLRSGRNGDGISVVTPEMRREWEETVQTELRDPELRRWALEGGGW